MIDLTSWHRTMQARWDTLREGAAYAVMRGDETVTHNATIPFEVGSAFKAFVAAEYARQVASGDLDPAMQLTVQPVDRVDSSLVLEDIPDGGSIALGEAATAMIAASDNTATDLVLRAVGPDRVRALLTELGIEATMPGSTRSLYAQWSPGATQPVQAAMTTMQDLARFYRRTVGEGALGGAATAVFLPLMQEEDRLQGAGWPAGVTCYRKSGMVEPPPLLAMSLGGAFARDSGTVTAFSFAFNVPFREDGADEESPLEPLVHIFSDGLRRGLDALAGDR